MNNWQVIGGNMHFDGYRVRLTVDQKPGGGGLDYFVVTNESDENNVKVKIANGLVASVPENRPPRVFLQKKNESAESDVLVPDPKTLTLDVQEGDEWWVVYAEVTFATIGVTGETFPNGTVVKRVDGVNYSASKSSNNPYEDFNTEVAEGSDLGKRVESLLGSFTLADDVSPVPLAVLHIEGQKIKSIDRIVRDPLVFRDNIRLPFENVLPDPEAGAMLFGKTDPLSWTLLNRPNSFYPHTMQYNGSLTTPAPYWTPNTNHAVAVTDGGGFMRFAGVPTEEVPLLDADGDPVFDENNDPVYQMVPAEGGILRFANGAWEGYHDENAEEGDVLTLDPNGLPVWGPPQGGDLPPGVKGDILYHDGSDWQNLGIGDPGQVLKAGGDDLPEWGVASGDDGFYFFLDRGNELFVSTEAALAGSEEESNWSLEFDIETSTSSNWFGFFKAEDLSSTPPNPRGVTATARFDGNQYAGTPVAQSFYRIPIKRGGKIITTGGCYRENRVSTPTGLKAELIRI
jgi:hypothetical protein